MGVVNVSSLKQSNKSYVQRLGGARLQLFFSSKLQDEGSSTSTASTLPRKRPAHPETWKKTALKAKRTKGEAYTRKDGTIAPARATKASCSWCRGCFMKFNDTEKACLIDSFNDIGSKNLQDSYLHGLISPHPVNRHRPRSGSRSIRQLSYSYKVIMFSNWTNLIDLLYCTIYKILVLLYR